MSEKTKMTTNSKPTPEPQKNVDCFDNREKRLGIIFKVIYVMSFFWLVFVFNLLNFRKGNLPVDMTIGMPIAMLAAAVSTIIISLVRYVYNELMCLKINPNKKEKDQRDKTEASYDRIFKDVKTGFIVSIAIWVIYALASYLLSFKLSHDILVWFFAPSFILYLLCLLMKKNDWRIKVEDFLCIIVFYSFYAFMIT